MVLEQTFKAMIQYKFYTIPELNSKITIDVLNKKRKILEKLGAPTNQQIIASIVDKEFFS